MILALDLSSTSTGARTPMRGHAFEHTHHDDEHFATCSCRQWMNGPHPSIDAARQAWLDHITPSVRGEAA